MPDKPQYNPDIHHRQSIRLKGYDYSLAGAYFLTICAQNRECLFGNIECGKMVLNEAGRMVEKCWHDLPNHYENAGLDEFIIMPNHVHCIIIIMDNETRADMESWVDNGSRADMESAPTTVDSMVQSFKRHSTIEYIKMVKNNVLPPFNKRVWQRNYYEHIIRDENELNNIRKYIFNNPANWVTDEENPEF